MYLKKVFKSLQDRNANHTQNFVEYVDLLQPDVHAVLVVSSACCSPLFHHTRLCITSVEYYMSLNS